MLVAAVTIAILTTSAIAAEKKTYRYSCKGGNFTITTVIDGVTTERWSRNDPVILRIGDEPPQTLTADPDAPDANSYKNTDYEFYALGKFITLTHKSHGVTVKFYGACRPD